MSLALIENFSIFSDSAIIQNELAPSNIYVYDGIQCKLPTRTQNTMRTAYQINQQNDSIRSREPVSEITSCSTKHSKGVKKCV